EYVGDTNFTGGTSIAFAQTVNQGGTTLSVASNLNPSALGDSVTFTATLSVVAPGAGTPTGTMQFNDKGTPLGSPATVTGNSASIATAALGQGPHIITAMYSGDTNFSGS